MSEQLQDIARLLGIQTFGAGLMSKIRQTINLLQEAAAERDQLRTELGDGTTGNKYRAELYDEVWQKARDMGYGNVTMALSTLEVQRAEQWSLRREAEAKVDTQAAIIAELKAELAKLQAKQGPALVVGDTYTSTRGFGRLLYLGETHDIDGWLPTFRTTCGERKHYRRDQLPDVLEEFALPHAAPDVSGIDCDRAYRNGLQAGYSFGASGDEEGYQRSMSAYGREIRAAHRQAQQREDEV